MRIALLYSLAISIGCLLLTLGCQGRDRTNPLDPLNPDTGGVPDNLDAVAGSGEVTLSWTDLGFQDLVGYDLMRWDVETAESTLLNESAIPPSESEWTDGAAIDGRTYAYVLRFLTPGPGVLPSVPDTATPGPVTAWVADFNSLSVRRISPDARDIVQGIRGLSGPVDVSISPPGDFIWVADYYGGRIDKYRADGDFVLHYTLSATGERLPLCLATDPYDDTIWIGGRNPDGVIQISDQGNELADFPSIPDPKAIAVDGSDGTVWVASQDGHMVYRIRPGEQGFTSFGGFNRPSSISVDPTSGRCWISDQTNVTVLNREGGVVLSLTSFTSPRVVAVDPTEGACWVADFAGSWMVSRVDASGGETMDPLGIDLISITDMTVDGSDGACWLTATQYSEGVVIKLGHDGRIVGRVGDLAYPLAISVIP